MFTAEQSNYTPCTRFQMTADFSSRIIFQFTASAVNIKLKINTNSLYNFQVSVLYAFILIYDGLGLELRLVCKISLCQIS